MATRKSEIPGWLTIGFAAGLLVAWAVIRHPPAPTVPAAAPVAPAAAAALSRIPDPPRDAARLSEVEDFFMRWGGYCIWKNSLTQFALFNPDTDQFTDFYEVRRVNRIYYFRTLKEKDWPLIDHGVMVRCPMWFAEPPEMREKFYLEHPEAVPGEPIRRVLPERAPLLPPRPPEAEEPPPANPPPRGELPDHPPEPISALTPGAGK